MKVAGNKVDDVPRSSLDKEHFENQVEEWIEHNPDILGQKLLIIDRQPTTTEGKKPDLLALDEEGNLVIIEVKNEEAKRDVIGQVLDYASQLADNTEDDLQKSANSKHMVLREAFSSKFGVTPDVNFNSKQRMIVVAPELDDSVPRIVDFLATYGLDIQVVTFGYHKDGSNEYITRGLIQPEKISIEASESIESYFQSPPYLAAALDRIRSFFQEENCSFRKPRGNDISIFSNSHLGKVGRLYKQKKAIVVGLRPNYTKPEDIKRLSALPSCTPSADKGRKTASGGEIINWVDFRRIRKPEDFDQYTDEIKRAMSSLEEYYGNPPADWKKTAEEGEVEEQE
jgi:hypothetical protein